MTMDEEKLMLQVIKRIKSIAEGLARYSIVNKSQSHRQLALMYGEAAKILYREVFEKK